MTTKKHAMKLFISIKSLVIKALKEAKAS